MATLLTFHGRAIYGENDALFTSPLDGLWVTGTPPPVLAHLKHFTERVIDGALSTSCGQTCKQRTGTACDLADDCDHWAQRLADTHNRGHEAQDPLPFVTSPVPKEDIPKGKQPRSDAPPTTTPESPSSPQPLTDSARDGQEKEKGD